MTTRYSHTSFDWQLLPRPFSVLAPMSDVTDTCFRRFIVQWGAPNVLYTEFASADALCSEGFDYVRHRLMFEPEESPLIAQIWGKSPETYFTTVKRLIDWGFDGVDINMGCPAPKVIKKGCCSWLIENRSLAQELIIATQEAAEGKIPVSIKTRLGFRGIETEDWAAFLLAFEPAALIMHGRVAKNMSRLPANWDEIAKVVALRNALDSSTVIVGNGDVRSHAEIQEKHTQYGVEGVMVGRGVFQNPYMFRPDGFTIDSMSGGQRLDLLMQHAALFEATWGHHKSYATLKKYFKIYVSNFSGAPCLRERLVRTKNIDESRALIQTLLGELSVTP